MSCTGLEFLFGCENLNLRSSSFAHFSVMLVVIMQDIISQFHFLHTHEILYSRQGRQREQDLPFRQLKQLYYKAQHSLHYCAVFNQTLSQRCIRISRLFQGLAAASEHLLLFIFYFFFILGLLKLMGG